jgi:hypothetical protein
MIVSVDIIEIESRAGRAPFFLRATQPLLMIGISMCEMFKSGEKRCTALPLGSSVFLGL